MSALKTIEPKLMKLVEESYCGLTIDKLDELTDDIELKKGLYAGLKLSGDFLEMVVYVNSGGYVEIGHVNIHFSNIVSIDYHVDGALHKLYDSKFGFMNSEREFTGSRYVMTIGTKDKIIYKLYK